MKRLFYNRGYIFALLFVIIQLFNISCSRKVYPGRSFPNLETRSDKNQLKDFLESGAERKINTYDVRAEEIISTARKYIGVPHCLGGTTARCMDCSGLLVTVFARHNIFLPHNSEEQARYGKLVPAKNKLVKGDLVFFIKSYRTNRFITHSGIYIGNNKFIHTSSSKGVTITSLRDPWWDDKFIFGTRIF